MNIETFTKLHGVTSLKMALFIDGNSSLIQVKLHVDGSNNKKKSMV
jgi:hypothetical protein